MTEEKDIDFRIYLEDIVHETKTDVIEKIRIDSSLMIEEGEIICPWQGTCNSRILVRKYGNFPYNFLLNKFRCGRIQQQFQLRADKKVMAPNFP